MKILNKFILLVLCFLSCATAETSHDKVILYVNCSEKTYSNIEVTAGQKTDTIIEDKKIIKVSFNAVRGGYTLLFGKIFNDNRGNVVPRLHFKNNDKIKDELSIDDIKKMESTSENGIRIYEIK